MKQLGILFFLIISGTNIAYGNFVSKGGETKESKEIIIPPYYQQKTDLTTKRIFFPLYFEEVISKKEGLFRELVVFPLFWYLRGPKELGFSFMPLFWYYGSTDRSFFVLPPYYQYLSGSSTHIGIAPLFFYGKDIKTTKRYLEIPPILWYFGNSTYDFLLIPPYYYFKESDKFLTGFPPLFFYKGEDVRGSLVIFPILWYYWDDEEGESTTVIPPIYYQCYFDGYGFGIPPFLFVKNRGEEKNYTLFPLFYYGRSNENSSDLLITPLVWYTKGKNYKGGGVLFYHWYKREDSSYFYSFIPFVFQWGNTILKEKNLLIFPLAFYSRGLSTRNFVVFPLWWDLIQFEESRRFGLLPFFFRLEDLYKAEHTTWIFPTIQYSKFKEGFSFNIHPIVYMKREEGSSYLVIFPALWWFLEPHSSSFVIFPIYWQFENRESRSQKLVFFPLYWQFTDPEGQRIVILNIGYFSGTKNGIPYWSFHFFPLFMFGRPTPTDIEWSILYGLIGYKSMGDYSRTRIFWFFDVGRLPED